MQYEKFRQYLLQGHKQTFVDLCLRRAETIENAYGREMDELTKDDVEMEDALIALEHEIARDDLDNYQNVLRHYYEMVHGHKFPMHVIGNRRLRTN